MAPAEIDCQLLGDDREALSAYQYVRDDQEFVADPKPTSVALRREAMVIESQDEVRVLGRWGAMFGCWYCRGHERFFSLTLHMEVFNLQGCPLSEVDASSEPQRLQRTLPNKHWEFLEATKTSRILGDGTRSCSAAEAWDIYLSEIPLQVRECASQCRGMQWVALEAIWHQPALLTLLSDRGGRRYAMAVFAVSQIRIQSYDERRDLYRRLASSRRTDLLSELVGEPVQRIAVALLSRTELPDVEPTIDSELEITQCLCHVVQACQDMRIARALSHCDGIDPRALEYAVDASVPSAWKSPAMFRIVSTSEKAHQALTALADLLVLAPNDGIRSRLDQSFQRLTDPCAVRQRARYWLGRTAKGIRFPEPPFSYGSPLRWLATAEELLEEGQTVDNCLATSASLYASDVLMGARCIFAWEGERRATVSIIKHDDEWYLDELQAAKGSDLPEVMHVLAAFDPIVKAFPEIDINDTDKGILNMNTISTDAVKATTIELLKQNLGELVHESGASLYTGWDSPRTGNLYVMGLNPGGDPHSTGKSILEETENTSSSQNPYSDENWGYGRGKAPHQTNTLKVIELTAGRRDAEFFATNAVFARSVDASRLSNPWKWWDLCWPIHQFFLSIVRPKVIICLGNSDSISAFRFMRSKLEPVDAQSYSYLDDAASEKFRAGKWTRGSLSLSDGSQIETTVLGVAHPSRFHVPAEFEAAIQKASVRCKLGLKP